MPGGLLPAPTQQMVLACSSDLECGAGAHCCIDDLEDTACPGGHWVSRCQPSCQGANLCVPNGPATQCLGTRCSPDTADVALPPNTGFGLCK